MLRRGTLAALVLPACRRPQTVTHLCAAASSTMLTAQRQGSGGLGSSPWSRLDSIMIILGLLVDLSLDSARVTGWHWDQRDYTEAKPPPKLQRL